MRARARLRQRLQRRVKAIEKEIAKETALLEAATKLKEEAEAEMLELEKEERQLAETLAKQTWTVAEARCA